MFAFFVLLLDIVVYIIIMSAVVILRRWDIDLHFLYNNLIIMLAFFPLVTLTFYILSFYDIKTFRNNKLSYGFCISALAVNIFLCATLLYFFSKPLAFLTPKTILILALVLYHLYIFYSRNIYAHINFITKKIIVFGQSKALDEIKKNLAGYKEYKIIAEYPQITQETKLNIKNLDFVLIAENLLEQKKDIWQLMANDFIYKGIIFKTDFDFYEELFLRAPNEGLNNAQWLLQSISKRNYVRIYELAKKFIDTSAAILMLPVFLPLGLFICILIKLIDRMPPLFVQTRTGLLGGTLKIYKFRTMRPNTHTITKLGSLLRRFRLDEIPQLINILRGDLSLVGPRPIWTEEHKFLSSRVPNHTLRNIAVPGITGWAQLNFKAPPTYCIDKTQRETQEYKDALIRFSYDVWYIKNRSFFLDLEILLKTVKRMFIKDKHF